MLIHYLVSTTMSSKLPNLQRATPSWVAVTSEVHLPVHPKAFLLDALVAWLIVLLSVQLAGTLISRSS